MGLFTWLFGFKPKKIKLGIALGSGGAKGFAELGALKAFEENDIHFDIVGGTSIGSIVGAFYSAGYSPTDIVEMLKRLNLAEIMNTLIVGTETSRLERVIERELDVKNIEQLKKPFICIATELNSGAEKVFSQGSIAKALAASSCFPPFFKPAVIDGVKYVDGAFTNSIPADKVREMGADYVIGIDLSNHEAKPGLLSKLFPTYQSGVSEPWAKGYANADLMLHPDLTAYRPISFNKAEEMFDIGYNTAMEFVPIIKDELVKLKTKKNKKNK